MRGLGRYKISPRIYLALWAIVFLRFLSPNVPFKLISNETVIEKLPSLAIINNIENILEQLSFDNHNHLHANEAPSEFLSSNKHFISSSINYKDILIFIWITGSLTAFISLLYTTIRWNRETKKLANCNNYDILHIVDMACRKFNIRQNIHVKIYKRPWAPCISGFFNQTILLPHESEDYPYYEAILHEIVHISRYDNLKKLICILIVIINWFNPLAWVAFTFYRNDLEAACDERAVNGMDELGVIKYVYAILSFASYTNYKGITSYIGVVSNKHEIKSRVQFLAMSNKRSPLISAISIVALLCILIAGYSEIVVGEYKNSSEGKILAPISQSSEAAEISILEDTIISKLVNVGYNNDEYTQLILSVVNEAEVLYEFNLKYYIYISNSEMFNSSTYSNLLGNAYFQISKTISPGDLQPIILISTDHTGKAVILLKHREGSVALYQITDYEGECTLEQKTVK